MSRLLLYHDFVSPFCRLALQVAVRGAERTGHEVRAVPFELRPAPEPLPPPDDPALAEELEAARGVAEEWGLTLGELRVRPRTRKAHEAVAAARAEGRELAMLDALYTALWERGEDVSRLDVLAAAGSAAGVDAEALHVALGVDRWEEAVVREQEAAAAAGLMGVPAFQVGDRRASGLWSVDELIGWIEEND
ncbi:MAG: DsbA family protein [Gemmatimonadota bacterium]|jgi:predicted DsbA family dithiol-disulfide isomerase